MKSVLSAVSRQRREQLGRRLRDELHPLVRGRMAQAQTRRVQAETRVRLAAVEHVADDRVPRVRAVYAQLVRAPRHRLQLDERAAFAPLKHTQTRLGLTPR